jgi:hypothetical protein
MFNKLLKLFFVCKKSKSSLFSSAIRGLRTEDSAIFVSRLKGKGVITKSVIFLKREN